MKRPTMIEGRPFIRSRASADRARCAVPGELGQVERHEDPQRHRERRASGTIKAVPTIAGPIPLGAALDQDSKLSALAPFTSTE